MDITQRFLNYTQFDTQSSEESQSVPSTPKQLVFAEYLKKELEDEGLSDVEMDENGYIYATLKANTKKKQVLDSHSNACGRFNLSHHTISKSQFSRHGELLLLFNQLVLFNFKLASLVICQFLFQVASIVFFLR